MDVLITMKLRTSSNNLQEVVDAVFRVNEKLVLSANLKKERAKKVNTILEFNGIEIRPDKMVTKEFIFPDDLDTININK